MALKNRLVKLERAAANGAGSFKLAYIAYAEGEKTEAEAVFVWEAENAPLSECNVVVSNVYELPARPTKF